MFHAKHRSAFCALSAAILLSGCVSFGAKPPERLLALDAAQKVAPGKAMVASGAPSITVGDPDAPRILDTVRVPVRTSPTSVAYVAKVQWSDTPRHLFQKLLAETIAATSNRIVLDPGQYSAESGQRLMGELVDFNIDAQNSKAVVTYDAILTTGNGTIITRQRFTQSVAVGGKIEATTVGTPLNAAANKVAADVAAWLATQAG